MRTLIILCIITSLSLAGGFNNLALSGYLENKTSLMIAPEESFSDIATLRLEGSWHLKNKGAIETHLLFSSALQPLDPYSAFRPGSVMERAMGELVGIIMSSDAVSGALSLMDSTQQIAIDGNTLSSFLKYLPYSSFYPRDNIVLDRALIKLYFKRFDLYVGRQTIAWGTGYAFNPTDIWNTKNPLDPGAPKTGVNALRVEIPFGAVSGLSLVASPGADLTHSSGGFRFKGNIQGLDFSLCGMRVMNADMELLGLPKKIIAGADCAGQIGDVGIWAEGATINPVYTGMHYSDFDSLYAQIDAGLDYSFANGLYVMAEYYYNGLGAHSSDKYGSRDLLNLFGGEMAGFGQNYGMAGISKLFFDYFTLSVFSLVNFNDRSAMLLPGIDYSFSDNITVRLNGQIGIGDRKTSEYGSVYGSAILHVTGYF